MAKSTGLGLLELPTIFGMLKPDVVVSVGDRFETMATAVAAAYMNIPLAHVQGGEVSGSIDEKVRHAVTKLSDIHFVANRRAREYVIRMGEDPAMVHVTGGPDIDLAAAVMSDRALRFDPFERYGGVGERFPLDGNYVVVLQHPVTTEYERAYEQVGETLYAMLDAGVPTLWFWPNVDAGSDGTSKGIRVFREKENPKNFHLFRNMFPEDFLRLLCGATAIVGNSSVAIRECSFLGVPAVNVGDRQEGREIAANVVHVPHDRAAIAAAVRRQIDHGTYASEHLYGDGRSGERIAKLLATSELRIEKRLCY
jgi:UDP-hydrolysing UDP-N-acetyl-D-glucosamine 2-epimerase